MHVGQTYKKAFIKTSCIFKLNLTFYKTDHSAVSARARKAGASEKPSFSLPKLPHFGWATGHFGKMKIKFPQCIVPSKRNHHIK